MRPQWEKLILFVIFDKYLLLDKRYSFLDNFTIFLRFTKTAEKLSKIWRVLFTKILLIFIDSVVYLKIGNFRWVYIRACVPRPVFKFLRKVIYLFLNLSLYRVLFKNLGRAFEETYVYHEASRTETNLLLRWCLGNLSWGCVIYWAWSLYNTSSCYLTIIC